MIDHITGHAAGVMAKLSLRQPDFIMRVMQLAGELIEVKSLGQDIVENEVSVQQGRRACPTAVKGTTEQTGDGIVCAEHRLEIRGGAAFDSGIESPTASGHKTPVAIEIQMEIDGGEKLPSLDGSFFQTEKIQRVFQVAFNAIPVERVVTRADGAELTDECGACDGAQDASTEGDVASFTRRDGAYTTKLIDEIIPGN